MFSLKTHPGAFASVEGDEGGAHHEGKPWGMLRAIFCLGGAAVLAA
jgi:hypothetical protein